MNKYVIYNTIITIKHQIEINNSTQKKVPVSYNAYTDNYGSLFNTMLTDKIDPKYLNYENENKELVIQQRLEEMQKNREMYGGFKKSNMSQTIDTTTTMIPIMDNNPGVNVLGGLEQYEGFNNNFSNLYQNNSNQNNNGLSGFFNSPVDNTINISTNMAKTGNVQTAEHLGTQQYQQQQQQQYNQQQQQYNQQQQQYNQYQYQQPQQQYNQPQQYNQYQQPQQQFQ